MKQSILVNTFKISDKAGKKCNVTAFNDVFPKQTNPDKTKNPVIQAFNSGYRVNKENIDWNTWNGLVFVDIDGKKFFEHSDKDYKVLNDNLLLTSIFYDNNFLAMQESFSHNGSMHFYFYFDVKEKSKHSFDCCAKYAYQKVLDSYIEIKSFNKEVAEYIDDFISCPGVVDTHNINPVQVFFVTADDVHYGFECDGCVKYIDFSKDATSLIKTIDENVEILSTDYAAGAHKGQRIIIDRNFRINTFTGNDVRFRISRIADVIFGDGGKAWCDKNFCKADGTSIYSKTSNFSINNTVLNWLINNEYLYKKADAPDVQLAEDEFLSDKYNEIIEIVDKYNRVEIVAGTGTGKTSIINGIGCDLFGYTRGTYRSLAYKYNAVVIVPYNTTNKLYNNCVEIGSQTDNKLTDDKPMVMVFDQAVKHWHFIKNRNIIIDEAHTLFTERNFRDKAIDLLNLLNNDHHGKIISFTATPTGEVEALNLKCIDVYKPKNKIRVAFEYNINIGGSIIELCDYFLNVHHYDRVVIMDDSNAERVYQNLLFYNKYTENEIAYIRANTKGSDDFNSLIQDEILTKPITICTRVAYNGLNFKNEDERIVVICSFRPMSNIAADYVQILGRFRNCKDVLGIIVHNKTKNDEYITFNEKNEDNKIIKEALSGCQYNDIMTYNYRCDDDDYVNAMNDVEKYYLEHSMNMQQVINDLHNYKYLYISRHQLNLTSMRYDYPFANEENSMFKEWINNTEDWLEKLNVEKFEGCKYLSKPVNRLIFVRNTYKCDKIEEYVMKNMKTRHLDGVVDELMLILEIATMTDEEFDKRALLLDQLRYKFIGMGNKKMVAKLNANEQKRNTYRKLWKGVELKTLDNMFKNIIEQYDIFYDGVVENRAEAGKTGGKSGVKKCVILKAMPAKTLSKYGLNVGDEYESGDELADKTGVKKCTITTWRKKKWIE